jgi:hypothetical protein
MDSDITPCTWKAKIGVGAQLFTGLFLVAVILAMFVNGLVSHRQTGRVGDSDSAR